MAFTIDAVRTAVIDLSPLPNLQALIDELTAIRDRPAVGGTSVVERISGGVDHFELTLRKPD